MPADGGLKADLERWSVPAEQRQALLGEQDDDLQEQFEIWPENRLAAQAFLKLETQWHYLATMSTVIRQGLRYEAVIATLTMMNVDRALRSEVFEAVQTMEAAALAVFLQEK